MPKEIVPRRQLILNKSRKKLETIFNTAVQKIKEIKSSKYPKAEIPQKALEKAILESGISFPTEDSLKIFLRSLQKEKVLTNRNRRGLIKIFLKK